MGQSTPSPQSIPSGEQEYVPPETGVENPDSGYQESLGKATATAAYKDPNEYPGFDKLDGDEFSRETGPDDSSESTTTSEEESLQAVESKDNQWHYDEADSLSTEQKAQVANTKSNANRPGYDDAGRPYRASDPGKRPNEVLSGDIEQQTFENALAKSGTSPEELLDAVEGQTVPSDPTEGPTDENINTSRRIDTEIDEAGAMADQTMGEAGSFEAIGGMDPTGEGGPGFSETVSAGPSLSQTRPGSHLLNRTEVKEDLVGRGESPEEAAAIADYAGDLDFIETPEGREPRSRGMDLSTQERVEGEATELFENTQQAKEMRNTILENTDVSPKQADALVNEIHQRRRNRTAVRTTMEAEGGATIHQRSSSPQRKSTTPPSEGGDKLLSRNTKISTSALDYEADLAEANQTIGSLPDDIIESYIDEPSRTYWENSDVSLSSVEKQWVNNLKRNIPNDLVENKNPTNPHKGISFNTDEWSQSDLNRFEQSLEQAKAATITDVVTQTGVVRPETADKVHTPSRRTVKGTIKHVQTDGIKDFRNAIADNDGKLLEDRTESAGIEKIVYLENEQGNDLKVSVTKSTENPHPDEEFVGGGPHDLEGIPELKEGDTVEIEESRLYTFKASEEHKVEGSLFNAGGWTQSAVTDRQSTIKKTGDQGNTEYSPQDLEALKTEDIVSETERLE